MKRQSKSAQDTFAKDVLEGLLAKPKSLNSKYFYDDEGSKLFQEIMNLPEYYVTRAEYEIFSTQSNEICEAFESELSPFDLIELGAGDGTKTAFLIDSLLKRNADFSYIPIDISETAAENLTIKFSSLFPVLSVNARVGDFFEVLENLKSNDERRKIILFLGSSIGNFLPEESKGFFERLRKTMSGRDFLFAGFDLQKDPELILRAYDDSKGITGKFNLNLLRRINRELGGNFVLENFSHFAVYLPVEGAAKSYIISRENQTVFIKQLNRSFTFKQWEPIFMEISQKYNMEMIQDLSKDNSFRIMKNFFDSRRFFMDSLWKPV